MHEGGAGHARRTGMSLTGVQRHDTRHDIMRADRRSLAHALRRMTRGR
jgi:hypothetical protein